MTTLFNNTSSVCLICSYRDIFWPSGLFMFLIFSGSGPDRLDAVYPVCTGLAVTREVKRGQQKNSAGNIWRGFKRASLFVSPRDISANKKLVKLLKCHHVCFCSFLGEAALQKRKRLFVHHVHLLSFLRTGRSSGFCPRSNNFCRKLLVSWTQCAVSGAGLKGKRNVRTFWCDNWYLICIRTAGRHSSRFWSSRVLSGSETGSPLSASVAAWRHWQPLSSADIRSCLWWKAKTSTGCLRWK